MNELTITRHPDRPGGTIKGRFDNAVLFATIATLIDAKSKPATSDDQRSMGQRQAAALADICGYVLDHGDVPHAGGHRPHLNVHIPLEELENRVRTAILDFGGTITTKDLRLLACHAAVIPIVITATANHSTSAAQTASSPTECAEPSPPVTADAPVVVARRAGATSTILLNGRMADQPRSTTW